MKVGILAGGLGSRIQEETEVKPKPMVEIGDKPILWHIMKHYAHYGLDDFVVALGYKGEYIKRWATELASLDSDLKVDLGSGDVEQLGGEREDWRLTLIDTGQGTATGGRIKRLQPYLGDEGTFMLTWGDGVSDIDFDKLLEFHRSHGKLATLTAARPPARFGALELNGDQISEFSEKPQIGEGWINGAFFVLEPEIFDYIPGDSTQWEREPLERLAADGELMAYRHHSYWQCMDTIRDRRLLEELWNTGRAPWATWEEN
ncbi:MAG TPA: glucose-1-phosphate cytidylyltransferase [Solirubrobacterales bacterium]|jgi:glucose-1-phosphate cytidylyltransferase|nr:glucose-1-phosphate cytidylyltransferase [Solirubrobacterales bacterium]